MPEPSIVDTGEHVAIEGLTQVFDRGNRPLTALSNVNLRVGRGEFVSVIGSSGCGRRP